MSRYLDMAEREDGWTEWIAPKMTGYKFCCCDCGLVHVLEFRVARQRVEMRAKRNNRSTGQVRRWMRP